MKKILIYVLIYFLLMFVMASSAIAVQDEEKGPQRSYFVIKGGFYDPQSYDLEEFDSDVALEFASGYYINPNLTLELGIGYMMTEADFIYHAYDIRGQDEITIVPITFSLRPVFPIENMQFYGIGGFGLYFTSEEVTLSDSEGTFTFSDDDVTFGLQIGFGALFNVQKNVFFGIEGKYFIAKAEFGEYGYKINTDLDGFIMTGNVGFRF